MDGRGTDDSAGAYDSAGTRNLVSGEAVVHGPVLQAARIESIVFGSPEPVWATPSQVPAPHRGFVNRTRELSLLSALLNSIEADGLDIVLVTGMGGIGKSQLVTFWVAKQQLKERFPDGQLYVDLGEQRRDGAVDVSAVVAGFLRALKIREDRIPPGLAERSALLRSVTAGRRMLVVIDDARHAAEVRPLLPADGLVVVTSRRRIPGLVVDGALSVEVEPLDSRAGLRLVRRWRESADEETAGELVQLCGGLPLLMRAAGQWLIERPDLELADIIRLLSESREEALDGVFDSVLDVLPAPTRHLYGLLGCCPGTTFTTATAEAAGGQRVAEALSDLLNAHLAAPASSRGHFALHDLAREHARARAGRDPLVDRTAVLRKVTEFFMSHAVRADRLAVGSGFRLHNAPAEPDREPLFHTSAEALGWLDAERANLLAVLRAAMDEGWYDAVWRLCDPLWALYHSRKHYADWIEAHQLAIEAAQWEGRLDVEVCMRNRLARAYYELGDLALADEQLDRAAPLLDAAADGRLSGMIWETMGLIELARSRPGEAIALFGRARDANAAEGDTHGIVVQTYQLAQALLAAGRLDDALGALAEAEEIAVGASDDGMRSRIGIVRGQVHRAGRRPELALESFTVAAEWAHRLGQLAKLEQVLPLVGETAGECGEARLRDLAERKAHELRAHLGLAPG